MPDNANEYAMLLPALDVKDGLTRVMNKKKLYWSLLGRFKMREMVETLNSAIASGEHEKVKEAAHAIKGAAGNLGCVTIRDMMLEVETRAKEQRSCADLGDEIMTALSDTEKSVTELLAMPFEP